AQTKDTTRAAAAGLARPMNQRLSTAPTWVLKRARRRAAQAAYRNAAAQPTLDSTEPSARKPDRAQWYITSEGAMPKLTRSARESYWTPNSLVVPVMRATRPSTPSNSAATKTAMQAFSKWPLAAARMA